MKRVLLFLSQGFEEMEAAAFIDVLGWTLFAPSTLPGALSPRFALRLGPSLQRGCWPGKKPLPIPWTMASIFASWLNTAPRR